MPTALESAMSGQQQQEPGKGKKKTVSERIYNEVVEQLGKKDGKIKKVAAQAKAGAHEMLYAGETLASTFATSLTKGAVGDDKVKVGGVSIPAVAGAGLVTWGIYDVVMGDNGQHQIAVGLGMLASEVADVGREAGVKLREAYDKDKKTDGAKTDAAKTDAAKTDATKKDDGKPPSTVNVGGPLRELEVGRSRLDRVEDPERVARYERRQARRDGREERREGDDGGRFRRRGGVNRSEINAIQPVRVLNLGADDEDLEQSDEPLDPDWD